MPSNDDDVHIALKGMNTRNKPFVTSLVSLITSLAAFTSPAHAEERLCEAVNSKEIKLLRWQPQEHVEVDGFDFYDNHIHWTTHGWRTSGTYQRSAAFNDEGVHRIYLSQSRYEYTESTQERLLKLHIRKVYTSPEDEARVRNYDYSHPLPNPTPAKEPIHHTDLAPGEQRFTHTFICVVKEDGTLTMPSDLSIWDILINLLAGAFKD